MPADVGFLNFGAAPITSFSDSMAGLPANPRNNLSPPANNWLYFILGGDTPLATPTQISQYNFGATLANGGGTGLNITALQFGANPTYAISTGICPTVMYINTPFYKATQKFVQYTFNDLANAMECGIGVGNFEDATGQGAPGSSAINHDFYISNQSPTLSRWNSGAGRTSLIAGASNLLQGDVWRISFDFTNPAQVVITTKRNGVAEQSFTDNAANRLTGAAFPVIAVNGVGNSSGGHAGYKNFSCGVGL